MTNATLTKKVHHVIKLDTLHHSNQLLVISNDSHTRMLSHHVCSHLPCTDFNEVQLLLLEDPVAHEVVPGQDLLRENPVYSDSQELKLALPSSFDCQLTGPLAEIMTKAARERDVSGQVR